MIKVFACLWLIGTLAGSAHAQPRSHKRTPPPRDTNAGISTGSDGYIERVSGLHDIKIQDDGAVALDERLRLIENAKSSISIETMLFKPDKSGCLILSALLEKAARMQAAKKPFQVKLLLDSQLFGPDVNEFFMHEMSAHGIEMRYYNPTQPINLPGANHRNHKKTFIIDGGTGNGELIIGGRNMSDDYFDMHAKDNFHDIDLQIKGSAVKKVQTIFDRYWDSPQVRAAKQRPRLPVGSLAPNFRGDRGSGGSSRGAWRAKVAAVQSCLTPSPDKVALRKSITAKAKGPKSRMGSTRVDGVIVASDNPDWRLSENRLGREIYGRINGAKKSVVIENPYFIPLEAELDIFTKKIKEGVKVDVTINSRNASPEFATSSLALYRGTDLAKAGGGLHLFHGDPQRHRLAGVEYENDSRWAIHSKAMIVDAKDTYVGSGNFDPRSIERINSEIGIIVPDNPAFAAQMKRSFDLRLKESTPMDGNGRDPAGNRVEVPNYLNFLQFMKVGGLKLLENQS